MSRRVQLILLCEDEQQEAFLRRLLEHLGWPKRQLRVVRGERGAGGHSRVTAWFPGELTALRSGHVERAIVVMIDGDDQGVTGRLLALDRACERAGIAPHAASEKVVVAVPTWNIETWLAYLGGSTIAETKDSYPRLERARDCAAQAKALASMCQQGTLRTPSPPSLEAACREYRSRLAS